MTHLQRILLATSLAFAVACGSGEGDGNPDAGECTPSCTGAACGDDDGCGGQCAGTCDGDKTCNTSTFKCEGEAACTPSCDGKACGDDDGCDGQCVGTCDGDKTCNPDTFVCEAATCTPSCDGKACGADDGCDGQCVGTCDGDKTCNPETFVCEADEPVCALPSDYGDLGALDSDWAESGVDPDFETAYRFGSFILGNDDYLEVFLGDEWGVFEDGIKPGVYEIEGDEADPFTCAACVGIGVDYDPDARDFGGFYYAISGTLTLTEVDGRLAGSISEVTFADEDNGACFTAIKSASFDTEYDEIE